MPRSCGSSPLRLSVFAAVCYNIRYRPEGKIEIRRLASAVVRLHAPTGDLGMNHLFLRADQTPTKAFRWLFLFSATALAGLLSVKGELVWVVASLPLVVLALILIGLAVVLHKIILFIVIGLMALYIVSGIVSFIIQFIQDHKY